MSRQDRTVTAHQRHPLLMPTWAVCSLLTLAAMVLQAHPPVVPLEFSMQLCMDPRDEAGLLLGPQGHITQVGPAAQSIGAARLGWGVEGVEVPAPAAPYAQQLETGQHGGCPSAPLRPLQQSIPSPTPGSSTVGFKSVLFRRRQLSVVRNANLRSARFRAPEAVKMRFKKQFQESPEVMQNQEDVWWHPSEAGSSGHSTSGSL